MADNPDSWADDREEQAAQVQSLEKREGELHLRFYLQPEGQEFALAAEGIREVISIAPDRITPIPNVSPVLLGALNLRGRVIWVADLAQFLDQSSILDTDRPEISIVAVENQDMLLGLAVDRVVGMDWLDMSAVQMASDFQDGVAPFLSGEWSTDADRGCSLKLLNQTQIMQSARWGA